MAKRILVMKEAYMNQPGVISRQMLAVFVDGHGTVILESRICIKIVYKVHLLEQLVHLHELKPFITTF